MNTLSWSLWVIIVCSLQDGFEDRRTFVLDDEEPEDGFMGGSYKLGWTIRMQWSLGWLSLR